MKKVFEEIIDRKNSKVKVIVEMSGNHKNSFHNAKKFVSEAIKFGADIIKFQVYTPDTITYNSNSKDFKVKSKGKWGKYQNLYDLYNKAHTPWKWIEKLSKYLNRRKVPWFASPFDITAVDFLEKIKCPAYKLASPEITDIGLIEYIAKTKKPLIISTGLATERDLDLAVKTIKKYHSKFAILKCTSAYPTPENELNLYAIKELKKRYKCSVGFSDHSLGFDAAKISVALGATIIEKHFKLDDDSTSIDSHFSAKISDLKNLKDEIIKVINILGNPTLDIVKSARLGLSGRRSIYVVKDIKKGEIFTNNNIRSIRPSYGMHPKYLRKILNKKAKKNISAGKRLTDDLINGLKIERKNVKK